MKKIIGMLLVLILLSINISSLAWESGSVPPEGDGSPGLLSSTDSAVPFYPVQWGMKLKDVIAATGGEDMGNKADVRAFVTVPGISEPAAAVFHCGKKGLESVSITLLDRVDTDVSFKDTAEGAAALDCVEAFFSSLSTDTSVRFSLNTPVSKAYRTVCSDVLVGYVEGGQGYSLIMEFYRPLDFDQKAFRQSSRFYMTTENNGDILFFNDAKVMTGFDVSYSRDSRYDRNYNVIASKLRLQGSSLSPAMSVPCYGIVYAYSGTVKPTDVKTMIFTVDGTMFSFTGINPTPLSVTQYKEYSQQYTVWMCGRNVAFMDALEKSKKPVTMELRGSSGFSLVFELPQKAKSGLVTDWKMFKKANGTDPAFQKMLESIATPMTVY